MPGKANAASKPTSAAKAAPSEQADRATGERAAQQGTEGKAQSGEHDSVPVARLDMNSRTYRPAKLEASPR